MTIVSSDMRSWDAPQKADILVGISSQMLLIILISCELVFTVFAYLRLVNCSVLLATMSSLLNV